MDELVVIATFNNPLEANLAKNRLQTAGIRAFLDGEASATMAWPWNASGTAVKLQVPQEHVHQAEAILAELPRHGDESEEEDDALLRCLACGTPLGEAEACPACGWSYDVGPDAAFEPDNDSPISELDDDEPGADELGGAPLPLPPAGRGVWWELGAVLAIGVLLPLVQAVYPLQLAQAPPYWLDAMTVILQSACTIGITLYLIYRSGEPWERFGLGRPRVWDVPLGFGIFLVADALWAFRYQLMPLMPWDDGGVGGYYFQRLSTYTDYALMLLRYAAGGYAEELVTRAYLVTRFQQLLRSRSVAVLLSAALFASYHCYQGMTGVVDTMIFGVAYGAIFLLLRRVWPLAIGHMLYNIHVDLAG